MYSSPKLSNEFSCHTTETKARIYGISIHFTDSKLKIWIIAGNFYVGLHLRGKKHFPQKTRREMLKVVVVADPHEG